MDWFIGGLFAVENGVSIQNIHKYLLNIGHDLGLAGMSATSPKLPITGLLALSTAAFATLLTEMMPAAVQPQMTAELHWSPGAVGFLVSVCAMASTIAAIPIVSWTRGIPRRPLFIALLSGFVLTNAITAVSSVYAVTVLTRILTGLLMGTLWPLIAGYAWHLTNRESAGRAVAIALAGSTIAMSFGLPLGNVIGHWIGWRFMFGLLSLVPLLLIGWVMWQLPPVMGEEAENRVSIFAVAAKPGFPTVLLTTLLTVLAHYTLYTYMASLAGHLKLAGAAATGLLIFGVGALVGIWIVGRIVDRHLRAGAWGAMMLTGLAMLAIGLFARFVVVDYIAVFVWGVSFGGVPTFFQTATNNTAGPPADVAASLLSTIYGLGIFGGSALGGFLLGRIGVVSLCWIVLAVIGMAVIPVSLGHRRAFPRTSVTRLGKAPESSGA
jgi:predicted MFS family arabinose efflux permease